MENLTRLTALQILIPTISSGLLLGGMILFIYIYSLYHDKMYLAVFFLGLLGFLFAGSEAMILFLGGQYRNIEWGRQFQRIEQVVASFFLFALPFFVAEVLKLNPQLKRLNRFIMYTGLGFAIVITFVAFMFPDLFISFVRHHPKWLINEADYARGDVGIVYQVRDLLLGIWILYFLSMIVIDLILNRRFKLLLLPLVGILVAIYSAIVDVLYIYTGINYDFFPEEIFSRFSFGVTFFIATAMVSLSRKFILSAKELEETYEKLSISERKYRILVEGTQDWIFTMDGNFVIKSGNNPFLKENRLKAENLGKIHLLELLYIPENEMKLFVQIIKDELEKLLKENKPVNLRAFFYDPVTDTPKEYNLRMENISTSDKVEILCKASRIEEDVLLPCFYSERQKYVIPNNIFIAKEVSKRLTRNLPKYIDKNEVQMIEMGVFEMLINAIEHGNLEISFEEKTEALQNGEYLSFITQRQKRPEYKDRKVEVESSITPENIAFKIKDDGKGFDHRQITNMVDRANEGMLSHGRGLSLVFGYFDDVKYNEVGNEVLLVKRIGNNSRRS